MMAVVPGFPAMVTCILIDWLFVAHLGNSGLGPVDLVQAGSAYPADPFPPTLMAVIGNHGPRMQPRARRDKVSEH